MPAPTSPSDILTSLSLTAADGDTYTLSALVASPDCSLITNLFNETVTAINAYFDCIGDECDTLKDTIKQKINTLRNIITGVSYGTGATLANSVNSSDAILSKITTLKTGLETLLTNAHNAKTAPDQADPDCVALKTTAESFIAQFIGASDVLDGNVTSVHDYYNEIQSQYSQLDVDNADCNDLNSQWDGQLDAIISWANNIKDTCLPNALADLNARNALPYDFSAGNLS